MGNLKKVYIVPFLTAIFALTFLGCSSDNVDMQVMETDDFATNTATEPEDYYLKFKLNDEMVDYSLSGEAQINFESSDDYYTSSFSGFKEIAPLTYSTISFLLVALDHGPIKEGTYSNPSYYENYDEEIGLPIYPNILATFGFPPKEAYVSRSAEITIVELGDTWVKGTFSALLTTATDRAHVIYTISEGEFKLENTTIKIE